MTTRSPIRERADGEGGEERENLQTKKEEIDEPLRALERGLREAERTTPPPRKGNSERPCGEPHRKPKARTPSGPRATPRRGGGSAAGRRSSILLERFPDGRTHSRGHKLGTTSLRKKRKEPNRRRSDGDEKERRATQGKRKATYIPSVRICQAGEEPPQMQTRR